MSVLFIEFFASSKARRSQELKQYSHKEDINILYYNRSFSAERSEYKLEI